MSNFYITVPGHMLKQVRLGQLRAGVVVAVPEEQTPPNGSVGLSYLIFTDPVTGDEATISSSDLVFRFVERHPRATSSVPGRVQTPAS